MTTQASTPSTFRILRLSELPARKLTFLVPGRLAFGKLAILDGDPELGKSLIALDLCARVTTGRSFPDGLPDFAPPANVVILSGEDDLQDTICPRLQSLGADLDRVFILHSNDDDLGERLSFPSQAGLLDQALAQSQAKLVVIDPIASFLDPKVNTNADQSVRRALHPLARLARKYQSVMLMLRNLNKDGGGQSLYRGCGSIAFVAMCRSAWLVGRDPKQPDRCLFAQVKNNLAPYQPTLAYQVIDQQPEPPKIHWQGTSELRANQLLKGLPRVSIMERPRNRACQALESFLEEKPHTSREVWAFAQEQGISERTLRRAREELDIRSQRVWADGDRLNYWLLPGQELPAEASPVPHDLKPWLDPLIKQFPSSSPIDDL